MRTVTCNACNTGFDDEEQQRLHYRSECHRYNLRRKVAGVPGVTEALFLARQAALAEGSKPASTPMLYSCALCGKEYRSSKAHERHLNSRSHLLKASQEPNASIAGITIVKPLPERVPRRTPSAVEEDEDDDEEEEWVEVDPSEMELADESTSNMQEDEQSSKSDDDMADLEELDISSCVMCDLKHDTIEDMQLAVNLGLPGAENLVVQRFQKLFAQTKCKESDELDAESPQGLLRTPETVAKFQAWAKSDFLPDMSNAMPLILEIVNLKPNLATNSAESDDDSIEKILEEKATACKLLLRYVDEFKEDFLPWIDQASSALVPLLWFCSCKEVQRAAIAALPKLLLSAKMAIEKGESKGRYESYVTKLSHSIIPALVKAAIEEPETELRASMVDSLNECMQIALSGANLRVEIVVAIFGPLPVEAFLNLRNALNVLQKENQVESDAYQIASSALMKVIQWHRDSIQSYELELNNSSRASWDLYDNWIFCKICLEEMERGYTFPKAFEEEDFLKMFFTRTGKVFRPGQFLNKWKGLKKMYNNGKLLHMTKDSKDNNPTKQVKDFITQYPLFVEVPGLFGLVIELFKNCDNKIESCDGRDVVSEQAKVDPPPRNSHSSCLDENSIINTLEDEIKLLELSNAEKERRLEDMEAKLAEKERMLNEAELLRKKLHNQMMDLKGHMRVFCRVRPLFGNAENMVSYPKSLEHAGRGIQLMRKDKNVLYTYDKVFDHTASQEAIFKDISELVQSAMDGYKVTIFSYGQTGSGKTYTMIGKPGADQKGIIPRALEEIFRYKRTWEDNGWTFDVKASMFQIYNEKLFDLLDMSSNKHCDIYTDRPGNAVLSNIEERLICNEADAAYLFKEALKHRFVDKTQMNEESSRSHFVFKLMISGHNKQLCQKVEGVLQMIDLAGSKTASKTDEIPDKRKNEIKNINMSLLALGNLFEAIGRDNFLPYRRSKLTHLLQNFFVGDCKILMFVNINPEPSSMGATLSSLDFAAKVHNCKIQGQAENHATQHQELDEVEEGGHLATTPKISKRVFRKKATASKHRGVQIGTSIKPPVSRRPESCSRPLSFRV